MAHCSKHGGTGREFSNCNLCQEEETRDRIETLIDLQLQELHSEDNEVTSDAACGHCGQAFVESTRKRPKRGRRWIGRLAHFKKNGVCPKCYFDLAENGCETEWTEADWRTFLVRKIPTITTSEQAKRLLTNSLSTTFPEIAGQLYHLTSELEAKELAAAERNRIQEDVRRHQEVVEARRRQEEEVRRRQLELETKRRQEEEARRRQEEETRRTQLELEAKQRKEEAARRTQLELEAKQRQEEEAKQRQEEEAKQRRKEEARRRQLELDAKRRQEERQQEEEENRQHEEIQIQKRKHTIVAVLSLVVLFFMTIYVYDKLPWHAQ